jgi:hypothetical protein
MDANARSSTGLSGATASCVTMIAVTPEIIEGVTKPAAICSKVMGTSRAIFATLLIRGSASRTAICIRITTMTGICASSDSLKNFGKYSL